MFGSKCMAGSLLEVLLECRRLLFTSKRDIGFDFPRFVFVRITRLAVIMLAQPSLGIGGQSDIAFVGKSDTTEEIDAIHKAPASLKLRRASCPFSFTQDKP